MFNQKMVGDLVMRALIALLLLSSQALAGPHDPEWNPPARYDHPYQGELTVLQLPQPVVRKTCQQLFSQFGYSDTTHKEQRGCAIPREGHCLIVTIDKTYKGTTPEAVKRHEAGHCNGWSASHPN